MQEPRNHEGEHGTPGGESRPLFGGDTSSHRPRSSTGGMGGPSGSVSASDERLWSTLSHVSVLVAPIGALIIWLIYKDKSPRIRFHSLQALWYQLAWVILFTVYWVILTPVLTAITLGFGLLILAPLGFLLLLVPLAHGGYAAYKVSQGEDYRYPFVADKISGGGMRAA
ncbi:MAG: DUF4870 domain-containing protein [Rubrobacter sp.]|nr:DUF4870 domain-containing protein [Rubrobacter sp.]